MEVRSSRYLRILVTQMAHRGLSAKEIVGALISMMARSNSFNQRPDTLMQDHDRQTDETLLRRTAGPYIWHVPDRGRTSALDRNIGRSFQ